MANDEYFIHESAIMFEKEYNSWFDQYYKNHLKSLTTLERAKFRKKHMPSFIAGLNIGLNGSIKEELKARMLQELWKKTK